MDLKLLLKKIGNYLKELLFIIISMNVRYSNFPWQIWNRAPNLVYNHFLGVYSLVSPCRQCGHFSVLDMVLGQKMAS